jgi:branched-subunit amino acid transport protein
MRGAVLIYIAVMALTTYLIRMIPFTFFTKKIKSRFAKSFIHYIPYAVLSAMTFPAVFYATGSTYLPAAVGTGVTVVLAYVKCPLLVVSLVSCAAAYLTFFLI